MDLNLANIPANINTVEKLAAWCGVLLHRTNSALKVLENPNFSDYACQASLFQAEDQTQRIVLRLNIELMPDYAESGRKIWLSAKEFSEQAIPADFLS